MSGTCEREACEHPAKEKHGLITGRATTKYFCSDECLSAYGDMLIEKPKWSLGSHTGLKGTRPGSQEAIDEQRRADYLESVKL